MNRFPCLSLVFAAVVAAFLSACGASGQAADAPAKQAAPAAPAAEKDQGLALSEEDIQEAGIKVEAVQAQMLAAALALTGNITPNQDRIAKVTPRLAGRIAAVPARLGARVEAGQVLARLESIELGEAQSAYWQAKSEAAVAESAFKRAEGLAADDIVPQKDYLRAKADAERARAALRAAADKLRLLGVAPVPEKPQAEASYPLLAPFAGTVIEKKAVQGESVPADQALFTVADLSTVWLEADIFEKDLGRLRLGAPAKITVAAYPDQSFAGKLTYLADTMDTATRTLKGRIEIANAGGRLKPGMFAEAHVGSNVAAKGLALPEGAVTLIQGQPTVFVATDKGFVPRPVETGHALGGRVPIQAGLAEGERVVVAGAYELKARLLKSQVTTDD